MNIVRYTLCLITFVFMSFFLSFSFDGHSDAASLEEFSKALELIKEFAKEMCEEEIPLEGKTGSVELSGKAKAELDWLLKKLANIGIEGAGSYKETKYQGLLQEDLAKILKDSRDCKLEILNQLKSIIPGFAMTPKGHGSPDLSVNKLWVVNGKNYRIVEKGLNSESQVYIDRGFIYTSVPKFLNGKTYIMTAINDKFDKSNAFLGFSSNKTVNVYVAYDDRYSTQPGWLDSFRDTGENTEMEVPGAPYSKLTFSLFKRTYAPGKIILGGNFPPSETGNFAMYTVIIEN
ncbi:MAG: hypothetical protein GY941_01645 [Planctomycetes bacterium]|nr:hypothetical protein [Planctomycetota bacterium]